MIKTILRWVPAVLWMVVIFALSSIPKLEATSDPFWNLVTRKIAHFSEYFILFLLIDWATERKRRKLSLVLTVLYAVSDEVHQQFVPLRTGSPYDVLIDTLGALLGYVIASLYIHS